jgi:hypothetical protein
MTQYMKFKSDPHSIEIAAVYDGDNTCNCIIQTTHDNTVLRGNIPFTLHQLEELRRWCNIQIIKMQKKTPTKK